MDTGFQKWIGENAKRIRRERGLDTSSIALELGLSANAITKFENAEMRLNMELVGLLCDALECSPNDIFAGTFNAEDPSTQLRNAKKIARSALKDYDPSKANTIVLLRAVKLIAAGG